MFPVRYAARRDAVLIARLTLRSKDAARGVALVIRVSNIARCRLARLGRRKADARDVA